MFTLCIYIQMGNSQASYCPMDLSALAKTRDISLDRALYRGPSGEQMLGRLIDISNDSQKSALLGSIQRKKNSQSQFVLGIKQYYLQSNSTMCSQQVKCLLLCEQPDYTLQELFISRIQANLHFSAQEIHCIINRVALGLRDQSHSLEVFQPLGMKSIAYLKTRIYLMDWTMLGTEEQFSALKGQYPSPQLLQGQGSQVDYLGCQLFSLGVIALLLSCHKIKSEDIYRGSGRFRQHKQISLSSLESAIEGHGDRRLKEKMKILTHRNPGLRKDIFKLQLNALRQTEPKSEKPSDKVGQVSTPLQPKVLLNYIANASCRSSTPQAQKSKTTCQKAKPNYRLKPFFNHPLPSPVTSSETAKKSNLSVRFIHQEVNRSSQPAEHPIIVKPPTRPSRMTGSAKQRANKENQHPNCLNLATPKKMFLKHEFSTIKEVSEHDQLTESKRQSQIKCQRLQEKYEGSLVKGRMQGFGRCTFPEGSYYEGQWQDNQMHGFGKLYYPNGAIAYEGSWRENQFHGKGKIYALAPVVFPHGLNYADLSELRDQWISYKGQLHRDQRHGWGELCLGNGERYCGQFRDDVVEGEGVFLRQDGSRVEGVWSKGKLIQIFKY